jgi:hypothetical protein
MTNELLLSIDKYNWFGDVFALVIFTLILIKEAKLSSTFIALAVVVLIDGIMLNYIEMLKGIKGPEYLDFVIFAWNIGFAAIDCLVIVCIHKLHRVSKTPYCLVTKVIILEYFTYGVMQVVRYIERSVFDTNYLKGMYQSGILAINLATTAMVVIFALIICYFKYQQSKGKEVSIWTY